MTNVRMSADGVRSLSDRARTSEVPSAERISLSRNVPPDWLDRLLVVYAALSPTAPLPESAGTLLALGVEVLEDVALGACIPDADGRQIVVRCPDRVSQVGDPDAARLFPEHDGERTFPIPGEEGATLHIGAHDRERLSEAPIQLFLDRLAQVLGAVIRTHRALHRAPSPELHRLQDQVIQLEKLASLGQMVAGIVHEINNPLTSIVAYSDYLRKKGERTGSDPGDVDRLARINEAAERILRFSRDLTEYSRPRKVVPASVPIHDIIDRALVFCEHDLDQTGVMVERNFGDIHPVRGVAGQLTQVFVNLFTNAAHAMRDQGGLLTITTSMPRPGEVEVIVTDDGHGIDQETLPKIFDPFFTTKVDGRGTGLGLSIVRSIVDNHGGRIRASGNSPKGTVFLVDLPVAASPEEGE
jgi:two-component system, NtrC family, sensor kinase